MKINSYFVKRLKISSKGEIRPSKPYSESFLSSIVILLFSFVSGRGAQNFQKLRSKNAP